MASTAPLRFYLFLTIFVNAGIGAYFAIAILTQNRDLGVFEQLIVLAVIALIHTFITTLAFTLGSLVFSKLPVSTGLREVLFRLCFAIPTSLVMAASIALRLGDSLPGGALEWPKNLIYTSILVTVAGVLYWIAWFSRPSVGFWLFASLFFILVAILPYWNQSPVPPRRFSAVNDAGTSEQSLTPMARRVLLIGTDGLDWKLLGKLAAEGRLNTLTKLVREGLSGELQPVSYLSPVAWTSVATGLTPEKHGILSFTGFLLPLMSRPVVFAEEGESIAAKTFQLLEKLDIVRRVPNAIKKRRAPAIWNIASEYGYRVAVVNWLLSNPAEQVEGYFLSPNALYWSNTQASGPGASSELVHPSSLVEIMYSARAVIEEYYPTVSELELRELTATKVTQSLLSSDNDLDLVMLYLNFADVRGHLWEWAVKRGGSRVAERWKQVEEGYVLLDQAIEWVIQDLSEEWVVILVSDHGWNFEADYPGHTYPVPSGVYAICCQNLPRLSENLTPNDFSILDIAPTVLGFLGAPRSAQMAGRIPFPQLERQSKVLERYPFEENWPEFLSSQLKKRSPDASAVGESDVDEEFLERLRALGYIE